MIIILNIRSKTPAHFNWVSIRLNSEPLTFIFQKKSSKSIKSISLIIIYLGIWNDYQWFDDFRQWGCEKIFVFCWDKAWTQRCWWRILQKKTGDFIIFMNSFNNIGCNANGELIPRMECVWHPCGINNHNQRESSGIEIGTV